MPKNNNSSVQLFTLAIVLPVVWKFSFYEISPFSFVADDYSIIRFVIFCSLVYIYFKPYNKYLISNIVSLFLIFLTYSITLYSFDIIIHFGVNKDLKVDYLNFFYEKYYDASMQQELKSLNENYSVASKSEVISVELKKNYSIYAYFKAFVFDVIRYFLVATIIVKIRL